MSAGFDVRVGQFLQAPSLLNQPIARPRWLGSCP